MPHSQGQRPLILNIAANDSAGLAGIAQDIRSQTAFGVHSSCILTANTAQNNYQLVAINPVDPEVLESQLEACKELPIALVKVGMLTDLAQAKIVAAFIKETQLPMILDPVLASSSGGRFFPLDAVGGYVDALFPLATLVTPNREEAAELAYLSVTNSEEIELAAESLMLLGAQNVLITGGDAQNEISQDYFASETECFWLASQKSHSRNTRGTGCALASSIASCLALDYSLVDAVVIGKMAINQGLRESYGLGEQSGPLHIQRFPDQGQDLPLVSPNYLSHLNLEAYPSCELVGGDKTPLGLYPVIDRAAWLERLLPLGITTIQLRIKDLRGEALKTEIQEAVEIAAEFDCRLFINDYWELAIELGAYGIHLGQEDLQTADLQAIQDAGLRLGLSSHCHYEVARALTHKPSYLAYGPIFKTQSKKMPWTPQGISGLAYWQSTLKLPLVAIGGLDKSNIADVALTGVGGVAMISGITRAEDVAQAVAFFQQSLQTESRA